jgi:anti-sigma regulatory factor (Ser/Thr protein kinase)
LTTVFEPPPHLTLPLEREATAPRQARAGIRQLLGDQVSADFVADAQLLTSELVTNAVMYAPSGCRMSAWYTAATHALRVEVADAAPGIPSLAPTSPSHLGGRGLHLVASRSSDWGVHADSGGKSVWFELRR